MWGVAHHEHRGPARAVPRPPAPPTVIGPIADLRAELATSHDLRADALTPHAGQGAVQRDGGICLVHAMDHPAVEPLEELLGATDRRVESHLLAGGIAVEGDVEVVNPGAGQGNSSIKRFCRTVLRRTNPWTVRDGRTHRPGSGTSQRPAATVGHLPRTGGTATPGEVC